MEGAARGVALPGDRHLATTTPRHGTRPIGGLELLVDGTFVVTTYGHWVAGEEPYILSVRFTLAELDALARSRR